MKRKFHQTVLHLIVWYAGPGQNNNANFDTDVEAGGASEDENQVNWDDDHHHRDIALSDQEC